MLIKELTFSGDYERSLRIRRILCAALLLVGLVGIACYFPLVSGSSLPDFARSFYQGAASGITACALVLLIRVQYLLTHPEARKKARIQETDEREQANRHGAFYFAGLFTFFVSAAALFVLLPISRAAFYALLAVIAVYVLTLLLASLWLSRCR